MTTISSIALTLCLIVAFVVPTVHALQIDERLTNKDVLEMVRAQLSPEIIIEKIKRSRCNFNTEPTELAELKSKGVSDQILRAMVEAPFGLPAATTNQTSVAKTIESAHPTQDPSSFSVVVPEGSFSFRKLAVRSDSYYSDLRGEIVNNTDKNWTSLEFQVIGIDGNGNKIENAFDILNDIHVYGLKAGETKEISASLSGFDRKKPARIEIKLRDGEYLATYNFSMVKPKPSDQLIYDDPFIQMAFVVTKRQIGFVLKNKTDNPITIDWNQVSYIDIAGSSHKVMHEGVKYITRSEPQSPSLVPPTANLKDIVFPIDYVSYSSSRYSSGWREEALFPEGPAAGKYKDASFSIFMPLLINGAQKNYLFSFKIANVEM